MASIQEVVTAIATPARGLRSNAVLNIPEMQRSHKIYNYLIASNNELRVDKCRNNSFLY